MNTISTAAGAEHPARASPNGSNPVVQLYAVYPISIVIGIGQDKIEATRWCNSMQCTQGLGFRVSRQAGALEKWVCKASGAIPGSGPRG